LRSPRRLIAGAPSVRVVLSAIASASVTGVPSRPSRA
jgi:hypothetical protein